VFIISKSDCTEVKSRNISTINIKRNDSRFPIVLAYGVTTLCPFNLPNFNSPNSNYRVRVRVRDRVRRIEIRQIEKEPVFPP